MVGMVLFWLLLIAIPFFLGVPWFIMRCAAYTLDIEPGFPRWLLYGLFVWSFWKVCTLPPTVDPQPARAVAVGSMHPPAVPAAVVRGH